MYRKLLLRAPCTNCGPKSMSLYPMSRIQFHEAENIAQQIHVLSKAWQETSQGQQAHHHILSCNLLSLGTFSGGRGFGSANLCAEQLYEIGPRSAQNHATACKTWTLLRWKLCKCTTLWWLESLVKGSVEEYSQMNFRVMYDDDDDSSNICSHVTWIWKKCVRLWSVY